MEGVDSSVSEQLGASGGMNILVHSPPGAGDIKMHPPWVCGCGCDDLGGWRVKRMRWIRTEVHELKTKVVSVLRSFSMSHVCGGEV